MAVTASPIQFIGANEDPSSIQATLNQLAQNGQSAAGGVNFITNAAAAFTLTSVGNAVVQLTNGGAVTVTVDSAYNIVQTLPAALPLGARFSFLMMATGAGSVATPTLSDTAVTLAGTTSVAAATVRQYQGVVTQVTSTSGISTTAGTTFTSLTQVGSTNNFTVALGTNAIVPTVGQLVNLTVSVGNLPSGWYPINKVNSATSFVIATPPGTVWTATGATVGTGTVAPATYSPLVSLTGLYAIGAVTV